MQTQKRAMWRKLSIGVCSLLFAGTLMPGELLPHAGAVSGSDPIRVAVSINSDKYNNTFDTVSLTGRLGELFVGFNTNSGFRSVYQVPKDKSIRGSLDNFYVIAGEVNSWPEAAAIRDKLTAAGLTSTIFVETRAGRKFYQVVNGFYETLTEAQSAANSTGRTGLGTKIAGWYRLQAGSHSTYDAAKQGADSIRAQGYDAYVSARQTAAGVNSYEVWVGNGASSAERDALKNELAGKGIASAPVDYTSNYVLFKQDAVGAETNVSDHLFIESTKQEAVFQANGSPGAVRFEEKGITYRGQLILRGYRQRLAVVNKLPLDDYLKGVVPREMSTGWPLEALKAQAVAARSYAVGQSPTKWGIAQVDDTVWEQAYGGYTWEKTDTTQAVDTTRGQVLMYNNGTPNDSSDDSVVNTFFSATHGGRSADGTEVWGNAVPYLRPVDSHWDMISIEINREPDWHRVMLPSGMVGYVRHDFVSKTGNKNSVGLEEGLILAETNVRPLPDISRITGRVIGTAQQGERVLILETRKEYDDSAWMRGFSAAELQNKLGLSSPVTLLTIAEQGPSGRVRSVSANGQIIRPRTGDEIRSVFGVTSTLFSIEQTGEYTVLGANGRTSSYPAAKMQGQILHAVSGNGTVSQANGSGDSFIMINNTGKTRVATKDPAYILWGGGNGHGLGMSQWGAYGMAREGYKYDQILKHYYYNTYLTPVQ
ncbi:SpoIID/LytB domain-containing protein [Effusibacillus consociatus]|uniref:SpoIID/LytB domain-containing protein n=1 Tax=Effusibacillus consociatus TaxID=1117041 RepID=A0ABV9Q6Z2_9BACL